jgi:hypothetical protein
MMSKAAPGRPTPAGPGHTIIAVVGGRKPSASSGQTLGAELATHGIDGSAGC